MILLAGHFGARGPQNFLEKVSLKLEKTVTYKIIKDWASRIIPDRRLFLPRR